MSADMEVRMLEYGLALAGGGTRGAAHVGVLKALEEENLLPTSIAGTSAGSIAAGLFAFGMRAGELEEIIEDMEKYGWYLLDPDYIGILSFIPQLLFHRKAGLKGLIGGRRLTEYFSCLTDRCGIRDIRMKLVIPAVDLCSGMTISYTNSPASSYREHVKWEFEGRLCDIIMASCSVPGVFRPKKIGNYCLVDGGVTNNLPVDLLRAAGESKVVGVDLGVDYTMPHEDTITEVVSHSFSIMSTGLKDCMSRGEIFLLNPELPEGAGLLTFDKMRACMDAGYRHTKEKIPEIRTALMQNGRRSIKSGKRQIIGDDKKIILN